MPARRGRPDGRSANGDWDPTIFQDPLLVTGLAPHRRRPGRVAVEVNGTALGLLAIDLVADHGLRPGAVITRRQLDELHQDAGRTGLLDKGLDLLAVKARSSRDLRVRLRGVGGSDGDIAWVVDRLSAQGFLDDAGYARSVARGRMLSGGVSRRRVASELRRRGVDAETTGVAIADAAAETGLDEHGAAREAALKRLGALTSLEPAVKRRRLYAFLARRGYQADVVLRVLREVLGGDRASD